MPTRQRCPGPRQFNRRELVHVGLGTACALLPEILRQRAEAATGRRDTAVIFVSLGGGPSHFETYDPKPNAPAEYRGAFQPIRTNVPGVSFCELLPRQAQMMDKLAVVRSVRHREGSHIALHMVETGYFLRSIANARRGEMPSMGSIVSKVRGREEAGLPAFVSLPKPQAYSGPAYLGGRYNFFAVDSDPSTADFSLPNLSLPTALSLERLEDRTLLLRSFDSARRALDLHGDATELNAFQRQALELITGERVRVAFDLNREAASVRDRYGRNAFGQRLLLARRLVETGVPFVAVRTFGWDDHQQLAPKMKERCPAYDAGMSALIDDLHQRGLNRDVLVVAMGEFGRTPRVNADAGRDHWPGVMSVLFAGGDYRMEQVIGASDARGAAVLSSPYPPQSVLAMVYRHLGIDPAMTFPDFSGRPRHVLEERDWISELL